MVRMLSKWLVICCFCFVICLLIDDVVVNIVMFVMIRVNMVIMMEIVVKNLCWIDIGVFIKIFWGNVFLC